MEEHDKVHFSCNTRLREPAQQSAVAPLSRFFDLCVILTHVGGAYIRGWRVHTCVRLHVLYCVAHLARYNAKDDNFIVVADAKFKALLCVEALYNFVFNVRLNYLLVDFKLVCNSSYKSGSGKTAARSALAQNQAMPRDMRERRKELEADGHVDILSKLSDAAFLDSTSEDTDKARRYLASIDKRCGWVTNHDVSTTWNLEDGEKDASGKLSLVGVLLDLARYDDARLLTKALQLVDRVYSSQQNLFDLAVQAKVLLTAPSVQTLKVLDLFLPNLKRIGSTTISGSDVDQFNSMLCFFTSKCYWEGDVESTPTDIRFGGRPFADCWEDPGSSNLTNQEIVYNSGILPIVLNVIRRSGQPRSVLRNCFWFLRALCLGHKRVQTTLYESLDLILSTEAGTVTPQDRLDEETYESWENSMGSCIFEVFNDCRETCLQVTAGQVEKMLVRIGDGDAVKTYSTSKLLDALRAVAKVIRHLYVMIFTPQFVPSYQAVKRALVLERGREKKKWGCLCVCRSAKEAGWREHR